MKEFHEELLAIRERMKDPENWDDFGICEKVSERFQFLMMDFFREWPESTGSVCFPVPAKRLASVADSKQAKWGYITASAEQMWSPDHPYGAARLRLLDYLIERTKP